MNEDRIEGGNPETLSAVAHDLKNSLTVIEGYVRVLQDMRGGGDSSVYLERILTSSGAAKELLSDMIEDAVLKRGRETLNVGVVEVDRAVMDSIQAFQALASEKNVQLFYRVPQSTMYIFGDRVRLRRVIDNLLSNAIKNSHENGVVSVFIEAAGDRVEIHVVDNGKGVEADEQGRIFDKFYGGTKSAHGSVGLGLYICKRIAEAHGGTISVHSEGAGKGSIFSVILPKQQDGEAAPRSRAGEEWNFTLPAATAVLGMTCAMFLFMAF